jgi:hypothetical protein
MFSNSATVASTLPPGLLPGTVPCGTWSVSAGDAARQQTRSSIQYVELFAPVTTVAEYGPLVTNKHVIFACDNEADTSVINRHRTRDPRLSSLLRALYEVSTRFNFSFSAVHRPGVKNVLMDWSSRPLFHQFRADTTIVPVPTADLRVGELRHPPFLHAISFVFTNSRCVTINDSTSMVCWAPGCNG